jgi:hypothetical protein
MKTEERPDNPATETRAGHYPGPVPFASEPDFLVLHGLRVRGFAEADVLATAIGLTTDEVDKRLDGLEADGLVIHRAGVVSGWTLTGAGRVEDEARAADELDEAGARAAVAHAYGEFVALNREFLQLCTDWELRSGPTGPVVNDHRDAAYDIEAISRLGRIDDAAQPLARRLADELRRFDGYGARLANALERVRRGEIDWFTKPAIDSYHTVWFELHENLLATLGIERGKETA